MSYLLYFFGSLFGVNKWIYNKEYNLIKIIGQENFKNIFKFSASFEYYMTDNNFLDYPKTYNYVSYKGYKKIINSLIFFGEYQACLNYIDGLIKFDKKEYSDDYFLQFKTAVIYQLTSRFEKIKYLKFNNIIIEIFFDLLNNKLNLLSNSKKINSFFSFNNNENLYIEKEINNFDVFSFYIYQEYIENNNGFNELVKKIDYDKNIYFFSDKLLNLKIYNSNELLLNFNSLELLDKNIFKDGILFYIFSKNIKLDILSSIIFFIIYSNTNNCNIGKNIGLLNQQGYKVLLYYIDNIGKEKESYNEFGSFININIYNLVNNLIELIYKTFYEDINIKLLYIILKLKINMSMNYSNNNLKIILEEIFENNDFSLIKEKFSIVSPNTIIEKKHNVIYISHKTIFGGLEEKLGIGFLLKNIKYTNCSLIETLNYNIENKMFDENINIYSSPEKYIGNNNIKDFLKDKYEIYLLIICKSLNELLKIQLLYNKKYSKKLSSIIKDLYSNEIIYLSEKIDYLIFDEMINEINFAKLINEVNFDDNYLNYLITNFNNYIKNNSIIDLNNINKDNIYIIQLCILIHILRKNKIDYDIINFSMVSWFEKKFNI